MCYYYVYTVYTVYLVHLAKPYTYSSAAINITLFQGSVFVNLF